jgi:hypothetical protein
MHTRALLLILFAFILVASSCGPLPLRPTSVIASPPSGSTYREGEEVAIQSTSADTVGIIRVELMVDGAVVRSDVPPSPQTNYTIIQTWKATPGVHTIVVRSYNTQGLTSEPAAISIAVGGVAGVVPTSPPPGATTAPPTAVPPTTIPPTAPGAGGCVNSATFVGDVTVPDGTLVGAGQPFIKTWRVQNNGTCTWGAGYDLVLMSGEAMATKTTFPVPSTAPNATADLQIEMIAPASPGAHTGQWQLRNGPTLFGPLLRVAISVPSPDVPTPETPPTPSAPACTGNPNIASFTASPGTITAGGSSTLNWGAVTNAESAEIDQGIGGVETPGSRSVSPGTTTTYKLTARCGANTQVAQVTVTVNPPPPDVPAAPTGLSGSVTGQTTASISWTDNSNNEDGFKVYRSLSGVDPVVGQSASFAGTGNRNLNLTGLTCSETYSIYVKSFKGSSESPSSNFVSITTDPCTPTIGSITHTGQTVTVNWTDNSATPEESGFRIYFGGVVKKTVASQAGTGSRSTTITGLDCGTTYSDIRVSAYYGTRESPKSAAGTETTTACMIKVDFTKLLVKDDTDAFLFGAGEIRVTMTVEGSPQYYPSSSGTESISSGSSKSFSKVFNVNNLRSDPLNISVHVQDLGDDPDDMGTLSASFNGSLPTNFGAGNRSLENSFFKIDYTITVTAPP